MKKTQIIVLITLLHTHIFAGVHLLSIWDKFDTNTQQLSINQIFELNYLQEKLQENREQLEQEWTKNEDIRILIERTELAIDQSPATTQKLMKQRIINIFQQFHINIILTPDNSIQRVNLNHPEHVVLQSEQEDPQDKKSNLTSDKKKRKRQPATTQATTQPLQKIKGANRTRKRLEREWKERQQDARIAEMVERAKRSAFENQRKIDKINLIDQSELLKKDLQAQMAQQEKTKETENLIDIPQTVQETV